MIFDSWVSREVSWGEREESCEERAVLRDSALVRSFSVVVYGALY